MLAHLRTLVLAGLVSAFAPLASAQVAVGDVAVTGLTEFQFTIVEPGTGTQHVHPLSNTTGTGATWTQAILWDPKQPDSFLLGGDGFLGRVTITGPGTHSYSLITNQVGIVSQISFDANHQLVVCDSTAGQMLRVDPLSGAITPLTSGVQPWGTDANCGTINPANGDLWVGTNKALYRIPGGVGPAQLYSSGWTSGAFAYASGVIVDPATGEVFLTVLTAARVARVEADGTLTNLCPPSSVPQPNGLCFDENGDLVVAGGNFGLNTIHRVPRQGGTPVQIATVANQNALATGVAVVRDTCKGSATPYGNACAGTGGLAPTLTMTGCPEPGQAIQLHVGNGIGGATTALFFGLAPASIPMSGGCTLNVAPLVGPMFFFPLPPGGSLSVPGVLPPGTSGVVFTMQAFMADPNGPAGFAASKGLIVAIG